MERPGFDENAEILRRGHEAGLPVYLYVTIFDESWLETDWAWPWDPTTNWLSDFVRDHPDDVLADRDGARPSTGSRRAGMRWRIRWTLMPGGRCAGRA